MSFINVMLSRREVVLSLALVELVLFIALMLAIIPVLRKRWKRMQAQRKARQAAKIAQLKKKAAAKIAYQKRQAAEAAVEAEAEKEGDLLEGIEPMETELGAAAAVAAAAPVVTMQAAPTAAPVAAATVPASPITPATAEGATPAGTPAPFHEEEQPAEEEADGDLQSILDSVFVDDEANARYEVLLRDVEVMTADELVEMATKLNADLRARRSSADGTSEGAA